MRALSDHAGAHNVRAVARKGRCKRPRARACRPLGGQSDASLRDQYDLYIHHVGAGGTRDNEVVQRFEKGGRVIGGQRGCGVQPERLGASDRCLVRESPSGVAGTINTVGSHRRLFELFVEQPSREGRIAPDGSVEKAAYYTARAVGWLLGNDRLAGCLNTFFLGVY